MKTLQPSASNLVNGPETATVPVPTQGTSSNTVRERWPRWLLLAAAAWNVLGGASALLDPAKHFAQLFNGALSLNEPLQLFFYRCTWINVIAWGVGYALAASLPRARGPILAAGAAGKLFYFVACWAAFAGGGGLSLTALAVVLSSL